MKTQGMPQCQSQGIVWTICKHAGAVDVVVMLMLGMISVAAGDEGSKGCC